MVHLIGGSPPFRTWKQCCFFFRFHGNNLGRVNDTDRTKPMKKTWKKTALFDGFEWCFPLKVYKHTSSSALNCFLQFRWLENRNMVSSEYSSALERKSNLDFLIVFTHHFTYEQIIRAEKPGPRTASKKHVAAERRQHQRIRSRSWKKPRWVFMPPKRMGSMRLLPVKIVSSMRWNGVHTLLFLPW